MEPIRRFLLQPLQEAASSLPLPWRVALTLGPPLVLALLLGPRLLGLVLRLLSGMLESLGRGYAWVEYQVLRLVRRFGQQPWALVGVLDDGIEAAIVRGTRKTAAIARSPLLRRAIRLTLLGLTAIPLLCWYLAPKVEPGTQLQSKLAQGVAWTISFDSWVRTGTWPQPSQNASTKKPRHKAPSKAKPKREPSR